MYTSSSLAITCFLQLLLLLGYLGGRFLLWKLRLCYDRGCSSALVDEDEDLITKQMT